MSSIAVVPSGPAAGEVFVGTAGGGVWSSTDDGGSWVTHTDDVPTGLAIGALAIDPANPSIIYAGTGEANNCGDCFYGGGVLKSADGGSSWSVQNPGGVFTGTDFASLAVDPNDGSHLYAGTSRGIYESSDGGSSWAHPSGSGDFTDPAYGLVLDQTTRPTTVYVASEFHGIQKSTDGGQNFTTLSGLPPASSFGVTALGIGTASAAHPAGNQTLYAAIGATAGGLSMYKSTDGGSTWTQLTPPAYTNQSYGYGSGNADQAWYDNTLAVDPGDPAHVVAGGIAMVESTDGGANWSNVNGGNFFSVPNVLHPDFHALTFRSSGRVLIGCDGGMYEYDPSRPGPSGVSNLNTNLDTTQVYEDIGVYNNGAQILGGLQDNGTALGTGNPAWPDVLSGDGGYSAINPLDSANQFGEADEDLYMTRDGWAHQVGIDPQPLLARGNFVPPMTIVPNPSSRGAPTVYYGAADLYTTKDPTASPPVWTQVTHVGTGVSAVAVAPSNPAVVYVGFDDGTLQVSTNATSAAPTFTGISPGIPQWITHVDVDPTDPGLIALSFSASNTHTRSVPPMVETGMVSLPSAPLPQPTATFTNVTGDLPSGVASNSVLHDRGSLVVATDVGVFATAAPNGGFTRWSAVGSGLPNVQVTGLGVDANGDLYAATHGRGVWKLLGAADIPVSSSPPTISGRAVESQTLTEQHGGWTNGPTGFRYQWEACDASGNVCAPIPGATGPSYAVGHGDIGHAIRVAEWATNPSGTGGPASSDPTPAIADLPPVAALSVSPSSPVTGQPVTFDASGSSDPNGSIDAYSWDLGSGQFGDATGSVVTQTFDEAGTYTIGVLVTDDSGSTDRSTTEVAVAQSGGQQPSSGTGPSGNPIRTGSTTFKVTLRAVRAIRLRSFLARGVPARVGCSAPCALTVRVLVDRTHARRLHVRARGPVAIATARRRMGRAGSALVRIRPGPVWRRRLAHAGPLPVTLRVTARNAKGTARSVRRPLRLTR